MEALDWQTRGGPPYVVISQFLAISVKANRADWPHSNCPRATIGSDNSVFRITSIQINSETPNGNSIPGYRYSIHTVPKRPTQREDDPRLGLRLGGLWRNAPR